jgi:hypothetical protein
VVLSKAKGVWSTPPPNESRLNQAFGESRNVLLIFSVKESGRFTGFARMATQSRHDGPAVSWVLPPGLSARALGGVFNVDWVCRKEIPFSEVAHLNNPWNDGKPVKIGRDGQEIEPRKIRSLVYHPIVPLLSGHSFSNRRGRRNLPFVSDRPDRRHDAHLAEVEGGRPPAEIQTHL